MADLARLDPDERVDVGGWYDKDTVVKTGMPNRYSAGRLFTIASLKHHLIRSAAVAYNAFRLEHKGVRNPTWDQVFDCWPQGKRFKLALGGETQALLVKPRIEDIDSDENDIESETCESSSGSETEVETPAEADIELHELAWTLAKGARGKLHLNIGTGLVCNRELVRAEPDTGISKAAATRRQWSPRCYKALPQKARDWWSANAIELDHNG